MKRIFSIISVLTILIAGPFVTNAQQEVGHFAPGVLNIRDFAMPDSGFYGVVYNYFYSTNRLNDDNGNKINSVTIGPGPGVTLNLDLDLNVYALAPTFIWVSKWKMLGAKYGAYISPSFSNTSVGASLTTTTGSGGVQRDHSLHLLICLFNRFGWAGLRKNGTLHLVMAFMLPLENTIQKQSRYQSSDLKQLKLRIILDWVSGHTSYREQHRIIHGKTNEWL